MRSIATPWPWREALAQHEQARLEVVVAGGRPRRSSSRSSRLVNASRPSAACVAEQPPEDPARDALDDVLVADEDAVVGLVVGDGSGAPSAGGAAAARGRGSSAPPAASSARERRGEVPAEQAQQPLVVRPEAPDALALEVEHAGQARRSTSSGTAASAVRVVERRQWNSRVAGARSPPASCGCARGSARDTTCRARGATPITPEDERHLGARGGRRVAVAGDGEQRCAGRPRRRRAGSPAEPEQVVERLQGVRAASS